MLGPEGQEDLGDNTVDRWRQKMAHATTALISGWVSPQILDVFRYSNTDDANTLWRRLQKHYGNITDDRQLTLRDRVERFKQRDGEPFMAWLGGLNSRMAELESSGHDTDDAYRKMILRCNCSDRIRPIVTQLLLLNNRGTYEELCMSLLENVTDNNDRSGGRSQHNSYFGQRNASNGRRGGFSRGRGRFQSSGRQMPQHQQSQRGRG